MKKGGLPEDLLSAQIANLVTRTFKLALDIYVIIKFKQLFSYFLNIKNEKLKLRNRHLSYFNKRIIKLVITLALL